MALTDSESAKMIDRRARWDVSNESWEVHTNYGPVSGEVNNGIGTFLGIPYAAPPTDRMGCDTRRFGVPVSPEPLAEVRKASKFGPTPPRSTARICDRILSGDPGLIGGIALPATNWLTVNVWAPRQPAQPRPVMVWIHGGAFLRGASAGTAYDGATFARDGVVLVSFNYRRQPRASRSDLRPGMGSGQHREFRWGPEQRHRVRRVGRRDEHPDADVDRQRLVP
jgi:hypothetical protein